MKTAHESEVLSQALADPSRRALLESLRFGQKSVSELVRKTKLKQPNVSNHLAKMRMQNIVHGERIGRQVYYSIALPVADLLLRMHEFTSELLSREDRPATENGVVRTLYANGSSVSGQDRDLKTYDRALDTKSRFPMAEWQDLFFQSMLAGNEDRVLSLVHELLAKRVSLPVIYTEIFHRAMDRTGELYQEGEIDEAREHLVSAMVERMMARVMQFYVPVIRLSYRALLACVAGNRHALGLRMLSDGLRVQGWDTHYLGADVPTECLVRMATQIQPELVLISCDMSSQEAECRRAAKLLDAARESLEDRRYLIALGGQHINKHPQLVQELPADLTARNLVEFLENIQRYFPVNLQPKPVE